jgi:5-methyltetrahydropteroyltriglutamate--homocysteine methyltransferase
VSTAVPESTDRLLARLDPIFDRRGEDDVAISTNAGFAASADRPAMIQEQQKAKLRLVETVARYYWGNEI